ncbi:ankyrin repeat domain-containing protein [Massilia oculi]|uniref:Ankyrin repeat domain-containing protein n=1 Tax=Massilia hydrophila TaxID=3044279 RepID=A0ABS7YCX3_9BURK|nr:ankyrin repeat domain-containing protein [Massilia oculi]
MQHLLIHDRELLAYFSATNGKEFALKELIDSGVSPDTKYTGESLLMAAAREEQLGIMRLLIEAGADVNYKFRSKIIRDQFVDALTSALNAGKYNAARLLLAAGYDTLKDGRMQASTLLFSAIAGGSARAVSYILSNVSPVDVFDSDGETPLTFAIRTGATDSVISELLLRGADPCKRNKFGQSVEDLLDSESQDKKPWDVRYTNLRHRLVCMQEKRRPSN